MRIAELQRWVCAEAGEDGWMKFDRSATGPKVAVIGGGPAALSCAYYLTLAGCQVSMLAQEDLPGGKLRIKAGADALLRSAVQQDVQGVMSSGIDYKGSMQLMDNLDLKNMLNGHRAIYLAEAVMKGTDGIYSTRLDADLSSSYNRETGQMADLPGVFIGEDFMMNGVSVVEAAARGRNAAIGIRQYLNFQG